jgi:hypothetical protein
MTGAAIPERARTRGAATSSVLLVAVVLGPPFGGLTLGMVILAAACAMGRPPLAEIVIGAVSSLPLFTLGGYLWGFAPAAAGGAVYAILDRMAPSAAPRVIAAMAIGGATAAISEIGVGMPFGLARRLAYLPFFGTAGAIAALAVAGTVAGFACAKLGPRIVAAARGWT